MKMFLLSVLRVVLCVLRGQKQLRIAFPPGIPEETNKSVPIFLDGTIAGS
jgi:hypothetical protein